MRWSKPRRRIWPRLLAVPGFTVVSNSAISIPLRSRHFTTLRRNRLSVGQIAFGYASCLRCARRSGGSFRPLVSVARLSWFLSRSHGLSSAILFLNNGLSPA